MVKKIDGGRKAFQGQNQRGTISEEVEAALNAAEGSLPYKIHTAIERLRWDHNGGTLDFRFSEILDELGKQAHALGDNREGLRAILENQWLQDGRIEVEDKIRQNDPETHFGNWLRDRGQAIADRVEFYTRGQLHFDIDQHFDQTRNVGERKTFLQALSVDELPDGEEPKFAIDSIAFDQTFVIAGGDPKSLKTTFCIEMALGVLTGEPVMGCFETTKTGPVVFLQADEGENYFGYRIRQIAKAREISAFKHALHFRCATDVNLSDAESRVRLAEEIEGLKPALVVFDPLRDLFTGNENASDELKPVLDFCVNLRDTTGAIVVLVDHLTKPAGRANGAAASNGYLLRGSGTKYGRADSILTIQALNNGECSVLNAIHRYGKPPEPFYFRLEDERPNGLGFYLDVCDPPENSQEGAHNAGENRVRKFLVEHAFAWHSMRAIRTAAKVQHKQLAKILETMFENEHVESREGKQNAKEWRYIGPVPDESHSLSHLDDNLPF